MQSSPQAEPAVAIAAVSGPKSPASVSEPTGALAAAEPVTEPAIGDKIMKKRSLVHVAEISPLPSALVSHTDRRRKCKRSEIVTSSPMKLILASKQKETGKKVTEDKHTNKSSKRKSSGDDQNKEKTK